MPVPTCLLPVPPTKRKEEEMKMKRKEEEEKEKQQGTETRASRAALISAEKGSLSLSTSKLEKEE